MAISLYLSGSMNHLGTSLEAAGWTTEDMFTLQRNPHKFLIQIRDALLGRAVINYVVHDTNVHSCDHECGEEKTKIDLYLSGSMNFLGAVLEEAGWTTEDMLNLQRQPNEFLVKAKAVLLGTAVVIY